MPFYSPSIGQLSRPPIDMPIAIPARDSSPNLITGIAITAISALVTYALLPFKLALVITGCIGFYAAHSFCKCCDDESAINVLIQAISAFLNQNNSPSSSSYRFRVREREHREAAYVPPSPSSSIDFGPGPYGLSASPSSFDQNPTIHREGFGDGHVNHARPAPVSSLSPYGEIRLPAPRLPLSLDSFSLPPSEAPSFFPAMSGPHGVPGAVSIDREGFGDGHVNHSRPIPVSSSSSFKAVPTYGVLFGGPPSSSTSALPSFRTDVEENEEFGTGRVAHARPLPVGSNTF